mgnify:CR=1 FL=1
MKLPSAPDLRVFFATSAPASLADRMTWYFDRFWLEVADQHGYAYPAAFPEDSDLAIAHNAAHAQLIADITAARNV